MRKIICTLLILIYTEITYSQELPRRVYIGIRMENLSDDTKKLMEIDLVKGVLINEVLPKSTAQKAGFKKGDVLSKINDKSIETTTDLLALLSQQNAGEIFTYELIRNKNLLKGKAKFQSFPEEKYEGLDVLYTQTKSNIGLQRIIISKPKANKKFPVIAFIGGIGCYSLDNSLDSNQSEIQLLNYLSRAGYLCARIEKPGVGDNTKYSRSCQEVSFKEEMAGYVEAIKTLKQRDDVDSNSIFIVGHSMGGVFAPLIASETNIKGIIAYGTLGSNFIEYLAKTRRTIALAYNMNPIETDSMVKDFCSCAAYYFVEKMSTQEASEKQANCSEYLSIFDLRARKYNDELYDFNIPYVWSKFNGKALLLYGESDYIAAKEDHQIITNTVNYYHPGNAEFISLNGADHGMNLAASFQDSRTGEGTYNTHVGATILQWLNKIGI